MKMVRFYAIDDDLLEVLIELRAEGVEVGNGRQDGLGLLGDVNVRGVDDVVDVVLVGEEG